MIDRYAASKIQLIPTFAAINLHYELGQRN